MIYRYIAQHLCAVLMLITAQQSSAQVAARDQWRFGMGQVNTPYTNPQNASVGPSSNPLVEIGWSRELSGPWSVRAGFTYALESNRQTQRSTNFLGGRTQSTEIDISTQANVFQVGVGLKLAQGTWGKLTTTGMLTHTRGALSSMVIDTFQGGGQLTQQTISGGSVRGNMNRLMLGLEYQLPPIGTLAGLSPYVNAQKFTSDNAEGGKQTFITAGLIKTF